MKLNAKKSFALAGLALAAGALLPQAAMAQKMGWYVGGDVGQSSAKDACGADLGTVVTHCNDTDTAWRIYGGYQFHPNFAVEAGYLDLGKFTGGGVTLTPTGGVAGFSSDAKAKTWQLVGVGILPLQNNFSLFAKAGVHRWDLDVGASVVGFGSGSHSSNGTDFTFGVGAGYEFTPALGMRLQWERFQKIGDSGTTGRSDVDLVSVGLRYRF